MKYIYTVLISLILFSDAKAQSVLNKQVREIIADSSNLFRKFRGGLNVNDSSYTSSMQLDGTQKNKISPVLGTLCWSYHADIANNLKKKEAFDIADEWKDKISSILGNKFKLTKYLPVNYNPTLYGWKFQKGNLNILINVFQSSNNKTYWVILGFLYTSPNSLKEI